MLVLLVFLLVPTAISISVDTQISDHVFYSEETRSYSIVVNGASGETTVEPHGDIANLTALRQNTSREGYALYNVEITVPEVMSEQVLSGKLTVRDGDDIEQIPIFIRVLPTRRTDMDLAVDFVEDTIRVSERPRLHIRLRNTGTAEVLRSNITFKFRRSVDGSVVRTVERSYAFTESTTDVFNMTLPANTSVGSYYIQAFTIHGERAYTSIDTIEIVDPFWTPRKMRILVFVAIVAALTVAGWKGRQWYLERRAEEARYVFPVDYNKLPAESDDNYWVGRVAETSKGAYIDPEDLTTHAIVAGSTGAGKSVTASVIVEEALEEDVPVVVFDPTAQWTGFVKKCNDSNLLEHYDRFDMDDEADPHPYPGLIRKVDSGDIDIDFEELMNPGEVTVFTLDHLSTEEFDTAVRQIVDSIFDVEWEESSELELIVVFDEVHRLLEEYGGQGGYHALERGAREFRKWGVGLVMSSQVTADFKQAVSGNIMTEVQMQTKSMEDINRIKKKYGEQFAKRITSEEVGTGMIQNPQYNEGDPWFVDFRPTYHNPHKIPDEELEQYYEYTERADRLQAAIDEMDAAGKDVYDEELELKLATDKLKEGRFNMAEIYLNSLAEKLGLEDADSSAD